MKQEVYSKEWVMNTGIERSVILREENEGGRAMVTDER